MKVDPAEFWDDIYRGAKAANYAYGKRFTLDDIAQGIALDILENPTRYSDIGGEFRQLIMKKAGLRYCAQQAAMFLTYGDQTIYSSEELKKLIPKFYSPSSWPNDWSQPKLEDVGGVPQLKEALEEWAEDTKIFIEMFDIEYAIALLTGSQRKIIEKKYRDGLKLETKYEQNKHSQAIRFLTFHVNERVTKRSSVDRMYEGPGARKAVGNVTAIAKTGSEDGQRDYTPDAMTQFERINNYKYPENVRSKHVVNSPWRKDEV